MEHKSWGNSKYNNHTYCSRSGSRAMNTWLTVVMTALCRPYFWVHFSDASILTLPVTKLKIRICLESAIYARLMATWVVWLEELCVLQGVAPLPVCCIMGNAYYGLETNLGMYWWKGVQWCCLLGSSGSPQHLYSKKSFRYESPLFFHLLAVSLTYFTVFFVYFCLF